jgi:hypothetical protein
MGRMQDIDQFGITHDLIYRRIIDVIVLIFHASPRALKQHS